MRPDNTAVRARRPLRTRTRYRQFVRLRLVSQHTGVPCGAGRPRRCHRGEAAFILALRQTEPVAPARPCARRDRTPTVATRLSRPLRMPVEAGYVRPGVPRRAASDHLLPPTPLEPRRHGAGRARSAQFTPAGAQLQSVRQQTRTDARVHPSITGHTQRSDHRSSGLPRSEERPVSPLATPLRAVGTALHSGP